MNDTYLKSKKILIVDDEECLRSMLITILEDENFLNIITADCVKTALEICQQRKPDIAILDVMLPDGDGCFRMNMNEIATAVRQKLPLIEVIINNHVLGMVRQWQDLFYEKRYSATVLDDGVDYVKLAEAMGATGYRATNREEFNKALKKALASDTPVVIDCIINSDDKVWPMVAPGEAISSAFTGDDLKKKQEE